MTKSEAQTRSELIDQQLAQSSRNVKDPTQDVEEFDILTALPEGVAETRTPYEGHQFSDYALLGKHRKPPAVVEAKKTSRDAAIGREQAKEYCDNIQKQLGGELPFCFYTNCYATYFWDLENAPPRKIIGFPTRDDLERLAYVRRNRKPLTQEFINTSIAGRDCLCNFQVMKIQSKFQMAGISKRTISLDDQKKRMLRGKEVEGINCERPWLEKQVIDNGTNTLIVREFMEEAIKDAIAATQRGYFCRLSSGTGRRGAYPGYSECHHHHGHGFGSGLRGPHHGYDRAGNPPYPDHDPGTECRKQHNRKPSHRQRSEAQQASS
jgi:type I site-specific restriction endonuclease